MDRVREFLANPFKRGKRKPDVVMRRIARDHAREIRRKERRQWFEAFRKNPWKTLFVREKDHEEILKEHWNKIDRKIAFRKQLSNSRETLLNILKPGEIRKRFGLTLLQSISYFILSFLTVYILYQLVTIGFAKAFHIPVIWYYYKLDFPLYTFSPLYTRKALVVIFGIGPVLSLVLGLLSLRLFFARKLINPNLQLFFLWGFINGMNFFFGSYIAGFITRSDFIYASEWLFMSQMFDAEEIVFVSLSITVLLLIGRLSTPLFLVSSGSVTIITPRYRPFFMICQVIIPWIAGALVFALITMPHNYAPMVIKTLTPGIILLPTLFMYNSKFNENIHDSGAIRKTYFRWGILIAVAALLFFYRIILNVGLRIF